jgi:CysZ protein
LAPGVRGIVAIPILVNVLLFAGGMVLALKEFGRLMDWIEGLLPSWLDWLSFLLWPFLIVTTLLILAYAFTLIANLVASPFNGLLSERVERHLTGHPPRSTASGPSGLAGLARSVPRSLSREVRKMAYFAPRAVGCLLLFLIPVLGEIVAPALWFLFTAWMMAVEYADYPFDNHGWSFRAMHGRLKQSRGLCVGFGSTIALATMIPLLNLLIMPAAVCGATAMLVERFRPGTD